MEVPTILLHLQFFSNGILKVKRMSIFTCLSRKQSTVGIIHKVDLQVFAEFNNRIIKKNMLTFLQFFFEVWYQEHSKYRKIKKKIDLSEPCLNHLRVFEIINIFHNLWPYCLAESAYKLLTTTIHSSYCVVCLFFFRCIITFSYRSDRFL